MTVIQKIIKAFEKAGFEMGSDWDNFLEEEKQQIIDAYNNGVDASEMQEAGLEANYGAEQYYNTLTTKE